MGKGVGDSEAKGGRKNHEVREQCILDAIEKIARIASPLALVVLGGKFRFDAIKELKSQIIAGTSARIVFAPLIGILLAVITEKTGVSLNFVVPAGNEAEKLNAMIETFVAENPDIKVTHAAQGGYTDIESKLLKAIPAKTTPTKVIFNAMPNKSERLENFNIDIAVITTVFSNKNVTMTSIG